MLSCVGGMLSVHWRFASANIDVSAITAITTSTAGIACYADTQCAQECISSLLSLVSTLH